MRAQLYANFDDKALTERKENWFCGVGHGKKQDAVTYVTYVTYLT